MAPRIRYEGEVLRGVGSGREPLAAEGIQVKFVARSGVLLDRDTVVTRTDSTGTFLLQADAKAEGQIEGDLWIYPPSPVEPMVVPGLRLSTSRAPGDRHSLGSWKIDVPYFGYQFYLYYRATGEPVAGVEVLFHRTGGMQLESDSIRLVSDSRGYVVLTPAAPSYGTVVGDLTINLLPPRKPLVISGLELTTFAKERTDSVVSIGIGYRMPYAAILVAASSGRGVQGAEVVFQRTDGVQVFPDRLVAYSDSQGGVRIDPVPFVAGTVTGDVTVTPPPPGERFTIKRVRLESVDDDRPYMLLGYWSLPGL